MPDNAKSPALTPCLDIGSSSLLQLRSRLLSWSKVRFLYQIAVSDWVLPHLNGLDQFLQQFNWAANAALSVIRCRFSPDGDGTTTLRDCPRYTIANSDLYCCKGS